MFTDEQLEYIYGAVKEAHQKCFMRTLTNNPVSITCRESDKKRIGKYNEIMNIINKYTEDDNEYM